MIFGSIYLHSLTVIQCASQAHYLFFTIEVLLAPGAKYGTNNQNHFFLYIAQFFYRALEMGISPSITTADMLCPATSTDRDVMANSTPCQKRAYTTNPTCFSRSSLLRPADIEVKLCVGKIVFFQTHASPLFMRLLCPAPRTTVYNRLYQMT